jgi:Raf kinase inhibitor-like YbhB/YbcL family protein
MAGLFTISTDAIDDRGIFDPRYTCDQDNSSPELRWQDVPPGTAGFALIAEDLDAPSGIFAHWVIYNIPPELLHLPAGIPPQESLPNGIRQGLNSFGKLGYSGPCPPARDRAHRYSTHSELCPRFCRGRRVRRSFKRSPEAFSFQPKSRASISAPSNAPVKSSGTAVARSLGT